MGARCDAFNDFWANWATTRDSSDATEHESDRGGDVIYDAFLQYIHCHFIPFELLDAVLVQT